MEIAAPIRPAWYRSIKWKVVSIILVVTSAGLFLSGLGVYLIERSLFRQAMLDQLYVLAETIGDNSKAALAFDDRDVAREMLAALRVSESVVRGCLYDAAGEVFAEYARADETGRCPERMRNATQYEIGAGYYSLARDVMFVGDRVGTIYIRSDTTAMSERLIHFFQIWILLFLVVLGVSFLIAVRLQALITRPVARLVAGMKEVARTRDLTVRVENMTTNEFGVLVEGFNTMLADIQQAEHALQHYTEELERSNQELEQFAYVASHDLKAPMRAIDNLAGWIVEDVGDDLPEESRRHLTQLQQRATRMERLLDDLLQYSRAGRVNAEAVMVDTGALVEDIVSLLDPPSTFTVEVKPGMPVLCTPVAAIRQVLLNLIANALKHHDRADGRIRVSGSGNGHTASFEVGDDGPGIEPEFHERIFGMFQTLKPRDEVESSGMGLAIVKKLVEHHGGTITVSSEIGQGTTFRFTWIGQEVQVEEQNDEYEPHYDFAG